MLFRSTKRASLAALDQVYQWALAQPVFNIHASEYAQKALDFMRITVARRLDGSFVTRGAGHLRTFRTSTAVHPRIAPQRQVAGYTAHGDQHYIHVSDAEAQIELTGQAPATPFLADANAPLRQVRMAAGRMELEFEARTALSFTLANARACAVSHDAARLTPTPGNPLKFDTRLNGRTTITVRCDT